ncbi:hypothetical protein KY284_031671 [Solanum tuberosum]|nr:hypothetical protein KY284_031671 [Solanum tuberosum]
MESEPFLQCIKFTNNSQFPSTSIQDSSLIFANLTPTLIIEILSRLPVKSILQYRHVSSIRLEVKIYSLMSNSWRRGYNSCPPSGLYFNVSGKFVNRKLHWSTNPVGHEYNTMNDDWNIVSFDLTDEKWGKAESPPSGKEILIHG